MAVLLATRWDVMLQSDYVNAPAFKELRRSYEQGTPCACVDL